MVGAWGDRKQCDICARCCWICLLLHIVPLTALYDITEQNNWGLVLWKFFICLYWRKLPKIHANKSPEAKTHSCKTRGYFVLCLHDCCVILFWCSLYYAYIFQFHSNLFAFMVESRKRSVKYWKFLKAEILFNYKFATTTKILLLVIHSSFYLVT